MASSKSSEQKRVDRGHGLKKLKVLIYSGPKLVRVEELADPRTMFVSEFNSQGKEFGLTARAG